ncbi:hypothetical protein J4429_05615 [Candidatus Pacearchaeota archaeon]|nr:hypothetical protein [Candidatus Pacearchaeota archaeon]
MIQVHHPNPFGVYAELRRQLYQEYLAKRRDLPTEGLRREIDSYESKTAVGRFFVRVFSDEGLMLRIKASKQVLSERVCS